MPATLRCEIFPADLGATVDFYTRVLAFSRPGDADDSDAHYLALERDGVRVGASQRPKSAHRDARQPPVGVEMVIEVDDLDAERARVRAADWPVAAEISVQPWGLSDFRVLDPDGYYWRITTR